MAGLCLPVLREEPGLMVLGLGVDSWSSVNTSGGERDWQIVVGEPVCVVEEQVKTRAQLLKWLSRDPSDAPLVACNGSFCGMRWKADGGFQIFSDAMGLRPLYWFAWLEGICFATHLGTLRKLLNQLGVQLSIDAQGFAESLACGVSLGARTRWTGLKRLRHGMLIEGKPASAPRTRTYRTWREAVDSELSMEASIDALDAKLDQAIGDRLSLLPSRQNSFAFLSGGMDSRLVVAKLLAHHTGALHTLNVAPEGSQDAVLGNGVAALMATRHHFRPTASTLSDGQRRGVDELHTAFPYDAPLWWSGDGGSVGLGHVYLREMTTVDAPEAHRALASFLVEDNRWRFSGKAFSRALRQQMVSVPQRGVEDELAALEAAGWPREKHAFGFLLFGDQQRHLDAHFESLGERAFDLILPFFDARFIAQVLRTPTQHLLRHRLYNHWFTTRLGKVGQQAWQSYPGHEPCPYPLPPGLRLQWESWHTRGQIRLLQRQLAKATLARLFEAGPELSKPRTALAAGLTWLGWRDQSYVLNEANKYLDSSN